MFSGKAHLWIKQNPPWVFQDESPFSAEAERQQAGLFKGISWRRFAFARSTEKRRNKQRLLRSGAAKNSEESDPFGQVNYMLSSIGFQLAKNACFNKAWEKTTHFCG